MKQIKESLDEINSSNTMIAVIGIVIAITAIIATIYNSKKLNQQLHSNEREIRHRMRPIIVRGKYDDGNTYQIKHEYGTTQLSIKTVNTGPLPAIRIRRSIRSGIFENGQEDLVNSKPTHKDIASLGPGEYVDNIINLSWDESLALSNDKYYFELKLEYQSSESNEMYQYLIRGHFETEVLFQDFVDFK